MGSREERQEAEEREGLEPGVDGEAIDRKAVELLFRVSAYDSYINGIVSGTFSSFLLDVVGCFETRSHISVSVVFYLFILHTSNTTTKINYTVLNFFKAPPCVAPSKKKKKHYPLGQTLDRRDEYYLDVV